MRISHQVTVTPLISFVTLEFVLIVTFIQYHETFEISLIFLAYIAVSVAYINFPLLNLLDHKLSVDIKSLNCSLSVLNLTSSRQTRNLYHTPRHALSHQTFYALN